MGNQVAHQGNAGYQTLLPVLLILGIISICQPVVPQGNADFYSYRPPLKSGGPGCRYLVDQDNKPFFWSGDAAWSLIAQLSREDAVFYLDNRREKGFNVVMVNLIEHKFCTDAPADYYGDLPFTGKAFSVPNEKYFEHADFVIRSAAERNIIVLLAPLYLGYNCGDEGWCAEIKAASDQDLRSWGRFLGRRYRDFSNIIWLTGGDADPAPVKDKVLEMVRGIREYDTVHLFSAHNQPETMAVTPWSGESWLSVNDVYSYDPALYRLCKNAYDRKPVIPFYLIESAYENEHSSTPQQLRSQAYQAVLSGAMGHIFGNCPIWHFGSFAKWCGLTDWKTEMNNSGSVSMDYFQRLFRSRAWNTLTPDFGHLILTSGYGERGSKDYTTAACTTDRNTFIAYLQPGCTITVDLKKINGEKAKCWWYDPSDGKAELIGIFKTSGFREFTSIAENDCVLVIDNESFNLPPPGSIQEM
jgi:Protein of unknown function (DUF4038)/Putative collagen-binding domain of a collagenase